MNEPQTELELPKALRDRVLAAANGPKGASAPHFPSFALRAGLTSVLGLGWLSALAAVYRARSNLSDLPLSAAWLPLAAALVAGVGLTGLSAARGRAMLGVPAAVLGAVTLVAPLVLGGLAIGGARMAMAEPRVPIDAAIQGAMGCDGVAFLVAAPLLLGLVWLRRPLMFAAPWLAGAAAGVASYAWAHAVLAYHCPSVETWHLMIGHVLPAVPLALLGAWATTRAQGSRPRHFAKHAASAKPRG